MQPILLYNRSGKRLLTLKEAEKKGYGSPDALKQRIRREGIKFYKVGNLLLVLEASLPRSARRNRKTRKTPKLRRKPQTGR